MTLFWIDEGFLEPQNLEETINFIYTCGSQTSVIRALLDQLRKNPLERFLKQKFLSLSTIVEDVWVGPELCIFKTLSTLF